MKGKKMLAQAITLGLLLAAPCGAMAADPADCGIYADKINVNGNELYPDGKISNVNTGIYAKGSKTESATASFTLDNIDITANEKGVDLGSYGEVVLGNSNADTIDITVNGTGTIKGINVVSKNAIGFTAEAKYISMDITTDSGDSNAIYNNGSKVTLGNEKTEAVTINSITSGSTARGIYTLLSGTTNVNSKNIEILARNDNGKVNTLDNHEEESTLNLNGFNVKISASGKNDVRAIFNTGVIDIGHDGAAEIKITAESKESYAYGVSADSTSNTTLNADVIDINVTGVTESYGFNTVPGSTTNIEGNSLQVTANATGEGSKSIGIYAANAASDKTTKFEINTLNTIVNVTSDREATAISAGSASDLVIGNENQGTISLNANSKNGFATGLRSYSKENAALHGNNIAISADGSVARGIDINGSNKTVIGDSNSDITIKTNAKNESIGIVVLNPASNATINGNTLQIEATSKDGSSVGVHVANNSENDKDNLASLNIASENTVIKADNALAVMSQGKLTIDSNLYTEGETALTTRGGAETIINSNGDKTVQLNGDIVFDYDTSSKTGVDADVNINLNGADSYLNGNILVTGENIPEGDEVVTGMELGLSDGAAWTTDDNSFVNNLKLYGGIVNMQGDKQKVTIDEIAGEGTITTTDTTNKMTIGEKAANTSLTVKGVGEKLNADVLAQDAKLAEELAKTVVMKDNENQTAADTVKAEAGIINGEFSADVDKNGNVTGGTFAVNENNQAVSNMASIALMAWRAENNAMNKRLGELRNSTGEHGVWARMMRGESKYGEQNVKNQYNTYQLGYDEKLSTDDHWTVGAAISYTDGQSSFANGSGENKHTGLSLYGSYLGDDGSFVDLIAKYARLKHDFDVNGGIGSGDYDTNGYSVSAEYGKRFTKDNGFWLEPQVELTYGKVGSVSYMTDNGASVRQDGMDSIVGRLGVAAGKNIKNGNVYLRASYLYDFDGETSVTMSKGASTTFEQDLGGGWWEVGVGTNMMLSKATHLYFDVEKTYGGNVATPWQWNAGMRWSF